MGEFPVTRLHNRTGGWTMAVHRKTQYGRGWDTHWADAPPPPEVQRTYQVSLPKTVGSVEFPVEGCRGRLARRYKLWIHSVPCYIRDAIVIME